MGGACSRKRGQQVEDGLHRGVPGRYCKSGSSKWLATSFSRPVVDTHQGSEASSLLDLCIRKIREVCLLFPCALVWVPGLMHLSSVSHFCYRMLIDILHSLCSQGILVNKSSMTWCILGV